LYQREHYYNTLEHSRSRGRNYYYANTKKILDIRLKERQENPEKGRQASRLNYLRNPEKVKLTNKKWQDSHRSLVLSIQKKTKLRRLHRVPKFGQDGINEFYKNRPSGYEVDHIIPLQGKLVSGLHVIWNLQYLTPTENRSKGNRLK
jgi:5-methylcytosine-specific restriction endonuclease McrA